MSDLHARIENRTHLLFGTIRNRNWIRWMPLWIGPVGSWPRGSSYPRAWLGASGFEVGVFGRSVYVSLNR